MISTKKIRPTLAEVDEVVQMRLPLLVFSGVHPITKILVSASTVIVRKLIGYVQATKHIVFWFHETRIPRVK